MSSCLLCCGRSGAGPEPSRPEPVVPPGAVIPEHESDHESETGRASPSHDTTNTLASTLSTAVFVMLPLAVL